MQSVDGELRFSPSDLTEYLACAHASALSRAIAKGERPKAYVASAYANLIFAKGDQHEAEYLERLRAAGREVDEVGRSGDFATAAARTAELMREGADVIYQGAFVVGAWRGLADFVERVETPSGLGDWSYEVVDTKLARSTPHPRTRCSCASTARASPACRAWRRSTRTSSSARACARRSGCETWRRTSVGRGRGSRRRRARPADDAVPVRALRLLRVPAGVRGAVARRGSPFACRGDQPEPGRPADRWQALRTRGALATLARGAPRSGAATGDAREPPSAGAAPGRGRHASRHRRTSCFRSSRTAASRACPIRRRAT